MTEIKTDKADFFISYTSTDTEIAEWIAWQLEDANHSVVFQKWDFIPGSSFVKEMRGALEYANKMIAVISNAYFQSKFAMSEWDAAYSKDPDGMNKTLIPVRVQNFDVSGLAKPRVYIDLVGCDEYMAKQKLLEGIKGQRLKPSSPPKFPFQEQKSKTESIMSHPSEIPEKTENETYTPKVKKRWTDKDKDVFIKDAFEKIYTYFDQAKLTLENSHKNIEVTLEKITSRKFICELYADGTKKNTCKIWISQDFGNTKIGFSEGPQAASSADNSYNEMLTICQKNEELVLTSTMSISQIEGLDLKCLTNAKAGEYLWRRFTVILSY